MNRFQTLWLEQVQSDLAVLDLLRDSGAAACHQLHYLQMVTEKLSKAYFWRTGSAPPQSHAGFLKLMRAWGAVPAKDQRRIANVFGFKRFEDFQNWLRTTLPLAYELERLAPALAKDGPNPEYPWPAGAPTFAPASYPFALWEQLAYSTRGRQLVQIVRRAVARFVEFA